MEVQVQLTQTNIQRFEREVGRGQPGECWPWRGRRNPKGYGQFHDGNRTHTASRFAWAIANEAPFPADKLALHKCDNPPCVNPEHIWPGTAAENSADMKAKGRQSMGPGPTGTGNLAGYNANRVLAPHCPNGHPRTATSHKQTRQGLLCRQCIRDKNNRLERKKSAKVAAFDDLRAALTEIAGNGDGSGRNPQLMVDAAVAALAKIEGLSA